MTAALARETHDEESTEGFSNQPLFSAQPSTGLSICNWRNRGPNGDFITTSIQTSWKSKTGEGYDKAKVSLTFDELPHAIMNLQDAYRAHIAERTQQRGQSRAR